MIIYTLYNSFIGWKNGSWHFGERLIHFSAFIDNPIYVADLLTIGLGMISFNAIKSGKFTSLCIAHVITLFIGLVILQSRSMLPVWLIISLLTLLAGFFQAPDSQPKRHLFWLAIPLVILVYILASDTGSAILARADSYRFEIWQVYIRHTIDCGIWFGCGMNDGITYTAADGNQIAHAHNIIVANFAKTGLVGTILLIAVLVYAVFYSLKKNVMAGWMLVSGLTALMFDGSSLIKSPNERWIMIHLPLAYLIKLMVEEKTVSVRANSTK